MPNISQEREEESDSDDGGGFSEYMPEDLDSSFARLYSLFQTEDSGAAENDGINIKRDEPQLSVSASLNDLAIQSLGSKHSEGFNLSVGLKRDTSSVFPQINEAVTAHKQKDKQSAHLTFAARLQTEKVREELLSFLSEGLRNSGEYFPPPGVGGAQIIICESQPSTVVAHSITTQEFLAKIQKCELVHQTKEKYPSNQMKSTAHGSWARRANIGMRQTTISETRTNAHHNDEKEKTLSIRETMLGNFVEPHVSTKTVLHEGNHEIEIECTSFFARQFTALRQLIFGAKSTEILDYNLFEKEFLQEAKNSVKENDDIECNNQINDSSFVEYKTDSITANGKAKTTSNRESSSSSESSSDSSDNDKLMMDDDFTAGALHEAQVKFTAETLDNEAREHIAGSLVDPLLGLVSSAQDENELNEKNEEILVQQNSDSSAVKEAREALDDNAENSIFITTENNERAKETEIKTEQSENVLKHSFHHQHHKQRQLKEIDYVKSLSLSHKWNAVGGKSNSLFLKTHDDRFIIKQLSTIEREGFLNWAPQYFEYLLAVYEQKVCLSFSFTL